MLARAVVLLAATFAAVALHLGGVAAMADRAVEGLRFAALARPASGRVAIVEMDAQSAARIKRWPWPRANYALVVDRLRRAGAASIVFDVDFSSPSAAGDDADFAAALARADGLAALPTFGQQARANDARGLDAMPIASLRQHVALASVSISPDRDGLVRDAPLGTMTYGVPHPSLSAYIAHRSGAADVDFPIDFGVSPSTIPRLSFVAVRDGRFDAAAIRGRDVLIGATAVEMGDRYAVPRWSNLPGVAIQAIAAETLLRGVPHRGGAGLPIVAAALLAIAVLACRTLRQVTLVATTAAVLLVAGVLGAQHHGVVMPLAAALLLLLLATAGRIGLEIAARFRRQRLIDDDTGLPTRRALMTRLPEASAGLLVAVIENLDSLAAVLPAGAEHQLVLRLAERLQVAAGGEPVHRIADRLLAVTLSADDDPAILADRLRRVLLAPIEVAGRGVDAAVSIGIDLSVAPFDQRLATATLAAEEAARRGSFWRADSVDLSAVEQHVSLMGELDAAIAAGEIVVEYQPKLSLATGRVTGAEALVRWRTAAGRMIPPSLFIPLAEQADRIAPLTLHVLARVLEDVARWTAEGREVAVAVNMSAKLLGDARFDEQVAHMIAAAAVPPARLIFEVTESAALTDADAAVASLMGYHRQGIALSMDDYGTGQSTLTYLRRLPLSELKIDRSFVQHVAVDRKDEAMVRSTIELAHELGLKVVAEGVEDADCLSRLAALGCDVAQGYFIGRSMSATALEQMLGAAGEQDRVAVP